ncbi:MAG: type II toxin-antitoxin system Phd/YefM family antitoxin [Coriobacteriales bacterium]|jgi:antitoxin (DNA-binding transcriptional repressor) of toxin-antitoxin stability system|nr:type II toxin-antitoxin system Phd/YefM family antitoxin [Coriobacteriales bacterium]
MTTYTLAQAKANLSKAIGEVEAGGAVLITKHGHPAALMTRPEHMPAAEKRQLHGCLKEEFAGWQMPEDFDRMMQDEMVALFEGDAL